MPNQKYLLSKILKITETHTLEKIVNEYHLLINGLKEALNAFEQGALDKFDSLVGENACQIRAVKIALMAQKQSIDIAGLKKQADMVQNRLLEMQANGFSEMQSIEMAENLLSSELQIALSKDELFLLKCYLLTLTKVEKSFGLCLKEISDPNKLKQLCKNASTSFVRFLERKLRNLLAKQSVEFVRECATILKDSQLIYMSSCDFTIEHNNSWLCLPMFWTYKTLVKIAQREKIPIVLHVKFRDEDQTILEEELIYFVSNGLSYQRSTSLPQSLASAACIIEGSVYNASDLAKWEDHIADFSISEIILAGAADHRQFPDETKDVLVSKLQDTEYESFKSLAIEKGFSINNPSAFFIQHVYPAQISHVYEKIKKRRANALSSMSHACGVA